jgi:hypothetical protein
MADLSTSNERSVRGDNAPGSGALEDIMTTEQKSIR